MSGNVILTGFMGTGKTTVGRELATLLSYRHVDTDQLIAERHGSIPEIFESEGEDGFRRYEREVCDELSGQDHLVISTGGRLMLDEHNASVLSATGTVVCLVASVDEIIRRVMSDADGPERPLLVGDDPKARIRDLLAERTPLYRVFQQVETDGRSPAQIAAEIAESRLK